MAENTLMHDELVAYMKQAFNPPASAFSYGDGPSGSMTATEPSISLEPLVFRMYE